MNNSVTEKIGKIITKARESKGLTQSELAKLLSTSQSAVARMEKGEQNFTTDTLSKVSNVLKKDIITLSKGELNFKIQGNTKLSGEISINSSKNGAVAILCASLLNKGTTILHNVPHIAEVERITELIESIGVSVKWFNQKSLEIKTPKEFNLKNLNIKSAQRTRIGMLLLGVLSHFVPEFRYPTAGGCNLGKRTSNPHFLGLSELGVQVEVSPKEYISRVEGEIQDEVILYESGDTVTEQVLLRAARLDKETTIKYCSANYMVQDLVCFLQKLGVKIEGNKTTTLKVHGLKEISKRIEYTISEDPIECMFYITAAIITKSELLIKRCPIEFLELELYKLKQMGLNYKVLDSYKGSNNHVELADIKFFPSELTALEDKIECRPYPGLNMDNLPFFVLIATQAKGRTLIHDWPYEVRSEYYQMLNSLGADVIRADIHRSYVTGITDFRAGKLTCPPALRPAAILMLAMLIADGQSELRNVYSISRGYESVAQKLNSIGAKIEKMVSF
ncbi:UDP-N-acetylglucosamine 1-carboxyvinyltransferase [bacterium]|nr:UDP-N-acetylglucosamine 1-carboxyvinyltransferase [bacterium]